MAEFQPVFRSGTALVAAAFLLLLPQPFARGAEPSRAQLDFFERKVRPVLVEHCFPCHSAEAAKVRGKLLLDTRAGLLKGGATGPAIVPGKPAESLLLKVLRHEGPKMPPTARLPDPVIADFTAWIAQGAADPRNETTGAPATRLPNLEAGKRFWSFQPPRLSATPTVRQGAWPRTRIDRFLLARLEQAGLQPSPPADRRIWIRRVSFDLIGLPPTPEEVEQFVGDPAANAYEKVVERLLASPHYGERWARLWLDVARYAEDQAHIVGSDRSLFYPNAYLYRDWVIRVLNDDLPYDRFVQLQLAADLIEPADSPNQAALGFLGLGPKYFGRNSLAVMADEWEDRVDTVSRGLLGLTVACARCHDHKFDPIPTTDYYALTGVFASTRMFNRPLNDKAGTKDEASQPRDALHVVREGTPTDSNIFVRGDSNNKGPVVRRHFLEVLSDGAPKPFRQGSGRLDLAEAITNRRNPLTARVIVNRVWALNFGRPLVGTPSNFGALGDRPAHPELFDDLAGRFMDNGWSLKWLQREIVLSAAYRQSSSADDRSRAADPQNRLLHRMNRRRLSVESWRDALLSATGRLDHALGGPSLDPQNPTERRRTIYSAVSRLELNRMLALFDFPDPNAHADRRLETTTPLQKLFVLNSSFMTALAADLAERLETEIPGEGESADRRRIDRAYRLLYARPATEKQVRLGLTFLGSGDERAARRRQYAHALLATNEMLFID